MLNTQYFPTRAKRLGVSLTAAKHPNRAARKKKYLVRAAALTTAKPLTPAKVVKQVSATPTAEIRRNLKGPGRTYPVRASHGSCIPTLVR